MNRRPLASRGTKWAQAAASFLAQKNITPNTISILSIVFSLLSLIFYHFSKQNGFLLILAALSIQLRLLCNLFDGMVAIEFNKKSIYGNLFNDIPDRFADVLIIMGAGLYSIHHEKTFFNPMTLAWLNSILAVLTAYIRVLGASLGTPMFFNGVMSKPKRMAILTIATLLALLPATGINFVYLALFIMLIGQVLTVTKRIRLITEHLKLKG
ncbi:MAG: CDP-alcohol phosphatidyltransferase family protein [Alphaproteobacteria bacterium]|nr:MAG: CDP-alcohol phosphatidyltransferase family protein [Alphaproteobacteria bacterium]